MPRLEPAPTERAGNDDDDDERTIEMAAYGAPSISPKLPGELSCKQGPVKRLRDIGPSPTPVRTTSHRKSQLWITLDLSLIQPDHCEWVILTPHRRH
jgi:hypothetical protein